MKNPNGQNDDPWHDLHFVAALLTLVVSCWHAHRLIGLLGSLDPLATYGFAFALTYVFRGLSDYSTALVDWALRRRPPKRED